MSSQLPNAPAKHSIEVTLSVPLVRLFNALATANEDGSGYWAEITATAMPDAPDLSWMPDAAHWPQHCAALVGGSVTYDTFDELDSDAKRESRVLDRDAIVRGLAVFASAYPSRFAEIASDEADADSADMFLQCCLLGEVLYG